MRRPRDMSGTELAKRLKIFGYSVTRQVGSHMRLTTQECGEHHITIPNHRNLTIGKINDVIWHIVHHFQLPQGEVLQRLFE